MAEVALANYLTLRRRDGSIINRFQNYWVGETVSWQGPDGLYQYSFMPFGFSGVQINRNGDNERAQLVFPNNSLSRSWAVQAAREFWFVRVRTMLITPGDSSKAEMLTVYVAQVDSAAWDETNLVLDLASVLDAVGDDAPTKRITQYLVGNLPTTAAIRLQ